MRPAAKQRERLQVAQLVAWVCSLFLVRAPCAHSLERMRREAPQQVMRQARLMEALLLEPKAAGRRREREEEELREPHFAHQSSHFAGPGVQRAPKFARTPAFRA